VRVAISAITRAGLIRASWRELTPDEQRALAAL
jgi:hypothetical protein